MGKKKEKRKKTDRILSVNESPLKGQLLGELQRRKSSEETVMSGELNVGKSGNPVTIVIRDEKEGSEVEFSNVSQAWLMIEEKRKSSSGWLSLIVGEVDRVVEVLKFVARATVKELREMIS